MPPTIKQETSGEGTSGNPSFIWTGPDRVAVTRKVKATVEGLITEWNPLTQISIRSDSNQGDLPRSMQFHRLMRSFQLHTKTPLTLKDGQSCSDLICLLHKPTSLTSPYRLFEPDSTQGDQSYCNRATLIFVVPADREKQQNDELGRDDGQKQDPEIVSFVTDREAFITLRRKDLTDLLSGTAVQSQMTLWSKVHAGSSRFSSGAPFKIEVSSAGERIVIFDDTDGGLKVLAVVAPSLDADSMTAGGRAGTDADSQPDRASITTYRAAR